MPSIVYNKRKFETKPARSALHHTNILDIGNMITSRLPAGFPWSLKLAKLNNFLFCCELVHAFLYKNWKITKQ